MTNITVRIDDEVKKEAEALFENLGLSMSGAINVFFRQAIREQAIPFSIRAKTSEEKCNEQFMPDDDVMLISRRIMANNKEAYEVLAK